MREAPAAASAVSARPAEKAGASGQAARRREATISLEATPRALLEYEAFADGLPFLVLGERNRLKLAGEEILDNLIHHASPIEGDLIAIRAARRRSGIVLGFYFRSPAFACFVGDSSCPEPLFDAAHRRWRGIGLRMCNNLCRRIALRPGTTVDRIFLAFDPDRTN